VGTFANESRQQSAKTFRILEFNQPGVPLHDVWAIDLPRTQSGVTLDEFLRTASSCLLTPSLVVRADYESNKRETLIAKKGLVTRTT